MKIIAISGKAQHGKDTVARMIRYAGMDKGQKVLITHYADLLKYMCGAFLGWDGKKDDKGRALLQHVGTDIIRRKDPNFFVDFMVRAMDVCGEMGDVWDAIIIPDIRFPNEVDGLIDAGFDVTNLRIIRPDFVSPLSSEAMSHMSENAMDDANPDYTIINNLGLIELKNNVETLLDKEAIL